MAKVKREIKALTCRRNLALPTEVVIEKLNELVRGWVGYFYYGHCSRDLSGSRGFWMSECGFICGESMGRRSRGIEIILLDTFMRLSNCTRSPLPPHGHRLRKPLAEDDRKAGFGKTECPV